MNVTRLFILGIGLLTLSYIPSDAFAASGQAIISQEELSMRLSAMEQFRTLQKKVMRKEKERHLLYAESSIERTAHRRSCRSALRTTSVQARQETAERCYRGELTLELELLRKEKPLLQELRTLGSVDDALLVMHAELADALVAVINAIDLGVYGSISDLERTKESLASEFRTPLRSAWHAARERELHGWQMHMSDHAYVLTAGAVDAQADTCLASALQILPRDVAAYASALRSCMDAIALVGTLTDAGTDSSLPPPPEQLEEPAHEAAPTDPRPDSSIPESCATIRRIRCFHW